MAEYDELRAALRKITGSKDPMGTFLKLSPEQQAQVILGLNTAFQQMADAIKAWMPIFVRQIQGVVTALQPLIEAAKKAEQERPEVPSRVLARDEPCANPAECDIHGDRETSA